MGSVFKYYFRLPTVSINMTVAFVKYLLLFWAGLSFLLLVAKILFHFLRVGINARFSRLFFELFVGLVAVVFCYSLAVTKFQTIYLGLAIPFVAIILWMRNGNRLSPNYIAGSLKRNAADFAYALVLATPLFLFWFHALYNPDGINFKTPVGDHFYYADMSDNFNLYGKENSFGILNKMAPKLFAGSTPYHYTEIWLNAFFSRIFHQSGILCLLFISFPILNAMIVMGYLALWESQGRVDFIKVILSYLFLLVSGSTLDIYNGGIHDARFWYSNISPIAVYGVKLSVIYIVLIGSAIALLKGKELLSLFIFSLLCFLYTTLMPAVILSSIILVFIIYFLKRTSGRSLPYYVFYLCSISLYVGAFYLLNGNVFLNQSLSKVPTFINLILAHPDDLQLYKSVLMLMGRYGRNLFLFYILFLPFLLLFLHLLALRREKFNYLSLLLFSLFILISMCIAPLWEPMPNAFQFFSNALPAIVIMILILVIFAYKNIYNPEQTARQNFLKRSCLVIMFLIVTWHNVYPYILHGGAEIKYSDVYISKCLKLLANEKEHTVVGVLYNKEDLAHSRWVLYQGADPVYLVRNNPEPLQYVPLNINQFANYLTPTPLEESLLKQQPLYIVEYYDSVFKKMPLPKDPAVYFVSKNQVVNIFANKGAFPSNALYQVIKDSIVDDATGEKLYRL
jgi:hypothetical protein